MKKLFLLIFALVPCLAYGQKDTLDVIKVKYNYQDLDESMWPCDEIIRLGGGYFKIADVELDVVGPSKKYASRTYYNVTNKEIGGNYELIECNNADTTITIKFQGYDFVCKERKRIYYLIDKKPTFNGGDANSFALWVNDNLVYPEEAKICGVQGRVTVQFTIQKDGSVANVNVLRGADPLLDQEAVRVISSSPKWTPAEMDGKTVSVTYTFPVIFQLN